MFTGLVQALGTVLELEGSLLRISDPGAWPDEPWTEGESIAVNGCCLTLAGWSSGLEFYLSEETLAKTSFASLNPAGRLVNLERAMKVGDRLGGHIVQGHVDGIGQCVSASRQGDGWLHRFAAPGGGRFLAPKGSIAVDGISLTIVEPEGDEFSVAVIPHTYQATSLHVLKPGEPVNLEFDILVKHVERLLAFRGEI